MFHLSSLLFLHGHFETNLTDAPVHTILPNFPDPKARVKRTPHEDEQFGCLAKSVFFTGYEPKEFDKITSVDDDTTLINDPDHNICDFSETTGENSGQFGVSTVFESSVLHVSHGVSVSQKESKESMRSGNRCKTERETKVKRFCDQCCKVDGTVLGVILFRFTKNSILMNEISENTWNEELNKLLLVKKSIQRKLYSTEYNMEIQFLERRNSEHALFESQRELEPQKTTVIGSHSMGRSSST